MKKIITATLLVLLSATAHPAVRQRPTVIDRWNDQLAKAKDSYSRGDWAKGRDLADSVLVEMIELIASGPDASSALATSFLLRAIGEAGSGETARAAWDYGAAQALNPAFASVDLAPFGRAATVLEPWRAKPREGEPAQASEHSATPSDFTPPRYIQNKHPSYPGAKRFQCSGGKVEITSVINEAGEVQAPQLSAGVDPVLAAAALNTVRDWRFVPAALGGHPKAVTYILSVNFRVLGCL
jgi:hypothetical protein